MLIRFDGAHAERLYTDIDPVDDLDIANRADHNDPCPTIIRGEPSETITEQRSVQRALPIHQQHPTFTRLSDCFSYPGVVGVTSYRGDGARKALAGTKCTKLEVQMPSRRMRIR